MAARDQLSEDGSWPPRDGGWSVVDWRDGALARPPDSDI
jgi:hypothetical protein